MNHHDTLTQKLMAIQQKAQREKLIRNIAATLRRALAIHDGNDLPCIIGSGYESTNAEAIETWVRRKNIDESTVEQLPALIDHLERGLRKELDRHCE